MESRNAEFLRAGVIETLKKMSPNERVQMFIRHSEVIKKLKEAGDLSRKNLSEKKD